MARMQWRLPFLFAVVVMPVFWAMAALGQTASQAEALRAAMAAYRTGDFTAAAERARAAGPVGQSVIEWHRLRAAKGSFDDARAFLGRHPDWPGLPLLRRRSERTLPLGQRTGEVIAFFDGQPPQTGAGSVALIEAYRVEGRTADAQAQAVLAWVTQSLSEADEDFLLNGYGAVLKPLHARRLDMLLWRGRRGEAERMLPRVSEGWRQLARARLALRADQPGVDTLIAAVPPDLRDHPGLAYERALWRFQRGRYEPTRDLMLDRAGTLEALGEPARWANMRRILARDAMRDGEARIAYRLASEHGLVEGSSFSDLEWLSGYLALRYLDDPERARTHFRRFRSAVVTPISLGRAGYWEGRAEEALGNYDAAAAAFEFGAEYQTSFYGLLAAERAGLPMDAALTGRERFPDWKTQPFAGSSVLAAALLLQRAGERDLAERFMTHLAESLDRAEIGSLGQLAIELEEPHIATMIGKRAASMGITVPGAYYPVVDLGATDPRVPPELALAIARRESEFDPVVVSGAGARGLMQLMPGTAREVAGDLGLSYSQARLTSDPAYNARLGTTYLGELIEEFGNNFVLVSAGYNAGPSRPRSWIGRFGDPRAAGTNVIDWIEHIPFRETRNYVMRVTESLPVYRARLNGKTERIRLSQELSAR